MVHETTLYPFFVQQSEKQFVEYCFQHCSQHFCDFFNILCTLSAALSTTVCTCNILQNTAHYLNFAHILRNTVNHRLQTIIYNIVHNIFA